jgi:hypothetical protein
MDAQYLGNCDMVTYMAKFDSLGKRIEYHHFSKDSSESQLNYLRFNTKGNITSEQHSVGEPLNGTLIVYHYDSLNRFNRISHFRIDSLDTVYSYSTFLEYNSNSQLSRVYNESEIGIYRSVAYFYDQSNNLILEKEYKGIGNDNNVTHKDSTVFNVYNQEIRTYSWWRTTFRYEQYTVSIYDSLGRNTELIIYETGGENIRHHYKFSYNENSQKVTMLLDKRITEYIYSENGLLLKEIVKWEPSINNGRGIVEHIYSYTYFDN